MYMFLRDDALYYQGINSKFSLQEFGFEYILQNADRSYEHQMVYGQPITDTLMAPFVVRFVPCRLYIWTSVCQLNLPF